MQRTEAEYQADERERYHADIRRVENAPLADRRAARVEWARALLTPELIGERVGWMLAGNYGKGAYDVAREVLARPRMNHVAILSQMIAALEWGCPAAFAREAWGKLSESDQRKVDGMIRMTINCLVR